MRKIPSIITNPINNCITLSFSHPNCSLIWLHGLGDTSSGFLSFFSHSHSLLYQNVRIKLIQAPLRKITINNQQKCNSWYNIKSLKRFTEDQNKVFDFQHIKQSRGIIEEHVEDEVKYWQKEYEMDRKRQKKNKESINKSQQQQKYQLLTQINPYHRIFIGGFSQGGVMSLDYAINVSSPHKLPAGIISLSGYMLRSTPTSSNIGKFPSLIMHGQSDQIIKQVQAKHSYQRLFSKCPTMMDYHCVKRLGHTVRLEQLDIMKKWVKQINQGINVHYGNKQ